MVGVGPFSIQTLVVGLAILLAWLVARLAARRVPAKPSKEVGSLLLDAALLGFVAARAAYIAQWWPEYSARPMAMVAIGDGGFVWWLGALVACAFIGWRTRKLTELRRPALTGIAAGLVCWVVVNGVLSVMMRSAPPLPDLALTTLDGRPVALSDYQGRPVVLNLWASWCPPCRREMPAFEQAQAEFPEVTFLLVNQGESASKAREFLQAEGLELRDVLLDPESEAMQAVRSRGLPTTVFFDQQGRQVDAHLGEITLPGLKDRVLNRLK